MGFKVIRPFSDLQDNGYIYNAGDFYPREGYETTEERIQELATTNNKLGKVFIQKVGEVDGQEQEGKSEARGKKRHEVKTEQETKKEEVKGEFPRHLGGGYYELSNGKKVRGKEAALIAEQALKSGE